VYLLRHNYGTMHFFYEKLSLYRYTRAFRRDGVDMSVFCLAEREDAEKFRGRIGASSSIRKSLA